ncbi:DUF6193 family natural product biosynthesis protein [Streptomyces scopuliridis]
MAQVGHVPTTTRGFDSSSGPRAAWVGARQPAARADLNRRAVSKYLKNPASVAPPKRGVTGQRHRRGLNSGAHNFVRGGALKRVRGQRAELLEAAHREPRPRQLFPWTGMAELHFSSQQAAVLPSGAPPKNSQLTKPQRSSRRAKGKRQAYVQ